MQKSIIILTNLMRDIYPKEELEAIIDRVLEHRLKLSKIERFLQKDKILSEEDHRYFLKVANRLAKKEPVQYILGETEFFNLPFNVNDSVLIPRPETEELIQWILDDPLSSTGNILDMGTGSGCIPISIAKHCSKAKVSACDISEGALSVSTDNNKLNDTSVSFFKYDILSEKPLNQSYDIIVSNPPYVLESEKKLMNENVLQHEPHLALFVDDSDALLFYRKIAQFAINHLKSGGKLYFEINEVKGKTTMDLLKSLGYVNIELRKDIFGKDRMIKAIKP